MQRQHFYFPYVVMAAVTVICLLASAALDQPISALLVTAAVMAVGGGTFFFIRGSGDLPLSVPVISAVSFTLVPMALTAGGALFTQQLLTGPYRPLGMVTASGGVLVLSYCQQVLARRRDGTPHAARLVTHLSVYLSVFLLFVAVENLPLRPLIRAVFVGSISGLLSFELLRDALEDFGKASLYGITITLVLSELSWSLDYLPLGHLMTSLLLLLAYYLVSGIVHNYLLRHLSRGVALEFLGVTAVSLAMIYGFQALGGR